MKRIVPSLLALLVLAGCGTAPAPSVMPTESRGASVAAKASGGLISRALEPLPGVVEAKYRKIDDATADGLLARHPRVLTELAEQRVQIEGTLDWDRRKIFRSHPRIFYLVRDGKRYEIDRIFGYGHFEKAIGKRVTAYFHVIELKHPKPDIVASFSGVRYYD